MRTIVWISLLVGAIPCLCQPSCAQTAAADGPAAKVAPAARIGSLSPDEERRAARVRARRAAAAAAKAAPASTAASTPATPVEKKPAVAAQEPAAKPAGGPLKAASRTPRIRAAAAAPHRVHARSPHYARAYPYREPRIGDRVPPGVPLYGAPAYGPPPYRETAIDPPMPVVRYAPYPMERPGYPPYPGTGY